MSAGAAGASAGEAGLDALYREELGAELRSLDLERRRELRGAVRYAGAGAVLGVVLLALAALGSSPGHPLWFAAAGLAAIAVPLGLGYWRLAAVAARARDAMIAAVCDHFGLSYAHDAEGFALERYRQNGLIPGHDRRRLEDRIRGEFESVQIDFCEAELERRYRNRKGHTRYRTVFRGVLMRLSFPKRFSCRTIVSRDAGALAGFLDRTMGWYGERVALESPEFERAYEVYSDDQVEARYLLTPTFMERLVELAALFDSPPQLAFEGNALELAAPSRENRFEGPGIFADLTEPRHLRELFREIRILFDVIHTLQLQPKTRA